MFQVVIERRVRGKTGGVVDLQQRGTHFVVKHDIHAEDLETHLVLVVVGLTTAVDVGEDGLGTGEGHHEQLFDLQHERVDVVTLALDVFQNRSHRPFVPHVVLIRRGVKYKFTVFLIDRVVGQVLALIAQILLVGGLVGFGGETSHALFVHVDSEGVDPCKQHVDPEVELQSLDQVGFRDVPLDHVGLVLGDLARLPYQENARSLRGGHRLYNKCFIIFLIKLII